jgi:hypothetical protein
MSADDRTKALVEKHTGEHNFRSNQQDACHGSIRVDCATADCDSRNLPLLGYLWGGVAEQAQARCRQHSPFVGIRYETDRVVHFSVSLCYLISRWLCLALVGDYSEVPGECPARTTCPIVCVANASDCPTTCEEGLVLCASGNCEETCHESEQSPCACEAHPVTCPRVVDLYDACLERFRSYPFLDPTFWCATFSSLLPRR